MPTVYVTVPADAGADLAAALVERQLAACVHRLPVSTTFRWEGDVVHNDDEVLLLAKTPDRRCEDLIAYVEEEHPYEVPCIEQFDESAAPWSFREWRNRAVDDDWERRLRETMTDRFDPDPATMDAIITTAREARELPSLEDRDWDRPADIAEDIESFSKGHGLRAGWNSWIAVQSGETSHLTVDAGPDE
jgi:periplasmic divalent cation tolerance protein